LAIASLAFLYLYFPTNLFRKKFTEVQGDSRSPLLLHLNRSEYRKSSEETDTTGNFPFHAADEPPSVSLYLPGILKKKKHRNEPVAAKEKTENSLLQQHKP
jgi:hypothetical protein